MREARTEQAFLLQLFMDSKAQIKKSTYEQLLKIVLMSQSKGSLPTQNVVKSMQLEDPELADGHKI